MERKTDKEIKRQQAAATESAANKTATKQTKSDSIAHETTLAARLRQHAIATTLGAGATPEEAIAEGRRRAESQQGEGDKRI